MNTPMTTRESEVDVLAVMDEWIAKAAHDPQGVRMDRELRQARAAVAEVFEAAKALSDGVEFRIDDPRCAQHDRLRTALRNAGAKV